MKHDNEWLATVKLDVEADKNQINQELDKVNQAIEEKSAHLKKLKIGLETDSIYKDLVDKNEKELSALESQKTTLNTKLIKADNKLKRAIMQNQQEEVESTRKAEEEKTKIMKQANQKRLAEVKKLMKENDEYYKELEKYDSDSQYSKSLKSKIASNNGKIGGYSKAIKSTDDTESQNSLNTLIAQHKEQQQMISEKAAADAQQKADAEYIKQQKEQEKQQAEQQAQIERQAAKERQEAYREVLQLTSQELHLQQEIDKLESKDKLTDSEQKYLSNLKSQLSYVQELKQKKTEIASTDERLGTLIEENNNKYQRTLSLSRSQNEVLKEQNQHTKTLNGTLANMAKYLLVYQGIGKIQQGMSEAVETIKELDEAFTDIQLVTQQTNEEIQELQVSYNQLAKEMSSTTQEVAEGATEWLRQGFTIEETEELLKSSMTLSKVGAIESEEATELLTSAINGFKIEAEDAMSIVDKVSAVDLKAATSSEELMTAMSRTASSAEMAGVSIDKLIGMIATVSSVTRKSASTIGESFKTIFARLQNVKAGAETDDEGESLNDVEKVLTKMGVKLRESAGEWRDMEDVIDEVAQKWETFNEVEQAQIATAIAGRKIKIRRVPEYIEIYSAMQYKYVA